MSTMPDCVNFFEDEIICRHCGQDTYGLVFEHSCRIECDNCNMPILDASLVSAGCITIFEIQEDEVH